MNVSTFHVADQRILRQTPAVLSVCWTDSDGEPADVTGPVTVHVTRADGTDVLGTGTATSGTGVEPRTTPLEPQADLDLLTAVWTDAASGATRTTYVEVVGGYYFTVAEVRAAHSILADSAKYPGATIIELRRQVEEELERICGGQESGVRSFVPRFRAVSLEAHGTTRIILPSREIRRLRSLAYYRMENRIPLTDEQVGLIDPTPDGVLHWDRQWLSTLDDVAYSGWDSGFVGWGGWRDQRIDVAYEYGGDSPPHDLKSAAMLRLRTLILADKSAIPERALGFSDGQGGSYGLATAGRNGFQTGHPDVDAVYQRYTISPPPVSSVPLVTW